MTFKEKLKKEYPGLVDDRYLGGCKGCPHGYGYEEEKPCKGINDEECTKCWNREMSMTAEEAWELARKLYEFTCDELETIFGVKYGFHDLISKYTAQEAKAKLEELESKHIRVGDVVYCFADCDNEWRNNEENYGVVTAIYPKTYHVLMKNGDCADFQKEELEKTGKHIDIQSVLEQIGKEE